ncbi:MAG: family 16 glycosylhydrolase [Acidobacteriota bacterium]
MRRCWLPFSLLAIALTPAQADPPEHSYRLAGTHPPPGYVLKWSDDFDGGELDLSKWMYRTGTRLDSVNRPEAVSVASGNAIITMKREPLEGKDYTAGGIISKRKFRYGYYEGRVKMHGGAGWHQSVWAIATDRARTTPPPQLGTEIDGMEFDSDNSLEGHMGVILWRANGKNKRITCTPGVYRRPLGFDATAGYHAYGFEWTERDVRFYLDGKLRCVLDYPFTEHRHDRVNFYLTSVAYERFGKVDESKLPGRMFLDHAAFYERDIYIDDGEEKYSEQGTWSDAGIKGFSFSGARESCTGDSSAVWRPEVLTAGDYQVLLHRVAPREGTGEARAEITASGAVTGRSVPFSPGPDGWVDLGAYRFDAGTQGDVRLTRTTGCVVADMAKFVRRPAAGKIN